MKYFISIILSMFFSIVLYAQQWVSQETAAIVAVNCLWTKAAPLQKQFTQDDIFDIQTIHKGTTPVFHIVNFRQGGYVIVSASQTYHPVIAFSFDGKFPLPIESPAVNMWLDNEIKKLFYTIHYKATFPSIKSAWSAYLYPEIPGMNLRNEKLVLPMLTTQWNQGMYYNEMCPRDPGGPDGKTYAGCVATAIGQVMNYFRYPLKGTGSYTSEYLVYGVHSVDYENSYYKWNEMPLKLNRSNHPVATLLYHIGVSVDMNYGPNGSGMWNHKAAHTMKTFFGYTDSTQYNFRDTTTINWNAMLIDHLDRGIVLYYAGWADSQYVSGHAFVCDGYQDSVFFHFNWGWGGAWDGYFHIDNLIVGGADFTTMHEAVINATPASNYPYYCTGTDTLRTLDGTIDDGSGPLYDYLNNANCSWLIQPFDTISSITIEFVKCNLQPGDVVKIYKGTNAGAPLVGTYTGNGPAGVITVQGKAAFIQFESDGNNTSGGFLLQYKCNQVKTCSGLTTVTAPSGTITDGSGPYNYQNTNNCRWRIEPPGAEYIRITFSEFDVDSTDFVKITDLNTNQVLALLKGNQIPDTIHAWTDKVFVQFLAGATGNAGGFTLHYESSLQNINELMQTHIHVYPNPASDFLVIEQNEGITFDHIKISLFTLTGVNIASYSIPAETRTFTINLSTIPSGFYLMKFEDNAGNAVVKKITISR